MSGCAVTVITASRYVTTTAFNNLDYVIDKYQTGVFSTTCDSPTDVWTLIVRAEVLSRRLSSWLLQLRTVGDSSHDQFLIYTPAITSTIHGMAETRVAKFCMQRWVNVFVTAFGHRCLCTANCDLRPVILLHTL